MRIKKIFTTAFILCASAVISIGFLSNTYTKPRPEPELVFAKNSTYEKEWKRVDSLSNKGLTKSALELIEKIYDRAKAENNAPQFVKSIMYRMRFEAYKEEFSLEKSINKLSTEVEGTKYPIRPVIQSLLADAYWQYYQNNRWKFLNRTTSINFKNDDISTWDLNRIVSESIKNYMASLENTDSLKRTKLEIYDEIIVKGNTPERNYRPTLYDFLAHRAVDFFKSTEADLNRPGNQFNLNDENYLKPYNEFIKAEIKKPVDSLNLKYYAVTLLQNLSIFHLNDKTPEALIDVELERLQFVNTNSANELKDSLFLQSLYYVAEKFKENSSAAEALYLIANWHNTKGSSYQALQGEPLKWHRKKALEIAESVIKKYPGTFGEQGCQSLIESVKFKSINFAVEHVNEPSKPFRALVTYRNFDKVYFRVIKTTYEKDRDMRSQLYGDKLIKKYMGMKVEKTFDYILPDDGDYNTHSTEVKIPELPYGYYVILASTSADFSFDKQVVAYANTWISDLAYTSRRMNDGSYDFYVMQRQEGQLLQGVKAQLWIDRYDYDSRKYIHENGGLYTTNENGFFNVPPGTSGNSNNFYIEFKKDADYMHSETSFYTYKPYDYNNNTNRTFFFTDRAIYRPGQTVYFKAICLSTDGKTNQLRINSPVTVTYYDVNYQKISDLQLTTNDYGTVSGIFSIPMGVLNGNMQITDGYGSAYISVEEYKRPKFEVNFNPIKGSFKIGDKVTAEGKALGYAGNNIDGAEVKYRVIRNVTYPYWWYWYRRYSPQNTEVEIINGVVLSNDTGGFVIPFTALPDPTVSKKDAPTYSYTVFADVTDINGETHNSQTYVSVGYKMINLNLSLDDKIEQSTIKPLKIATTNLNGVDEFAKGNISIYKLKQPEKAFRARLWEQPDKHIINKEEYYSLFPHDLYEDETNMYKWERGAKIADITFDTEKKKEADLSVLKNQAAGIYVMEGICKDKNGEEVKDIKYFTLYSNAGDNIPEQEIDWFNPIKNSGEPGEKASFIQASAVKDINYLFEVEFDKELVTKVFKSVSMKPVEIPIEEKHRGNFAYHISFVKYNRFYSHSNIITVPYTNKELDISFETFRNKLQPGQAEEWKMIIKNKKGEKETAEMLATMYDASLDAFKSNNWYFNIYNSYYSSLYWGSNLGTQVNSNEYSVNLNNYYYAYSHYYDRLNYFGLYFYSRNYGYYGDYESGGEGKSMAMSPDMAVMEEKTMDGDERNEADKPKMKKSEKETFSKNDSFAATGNTVTTTAGLGTIDQTKGGKDGQPPPPPADMSDVKARSNFNETAFFFPQLQTNEKGEVVVKFTVPESLTKWKIMAFAHTKDLKFGQTSNELITQKDLMVQPNAPRFMRENDKMTFSAKISNLSDKALTGVAELVLFDALTNKPLNTEFSNKTPQVNFTTAKGQSAAVNWDISIPEGIQAVTYKVIAKAGNFSDGEEMALPVLTNRMLVTESMPLPIRSKQTKEFSFTKFLNQNNNSTTLRNHQYTLEFTANPAWYAVQSLPYLMEYPYECNEQTFSRYYANSLASHIVNSKPKIKQVFDSWKMKDPDAFLSNLQKNQELKSLLLEETPWVMDAKDESQRKNRLALLFDLNRMSNELDRAMNKLQKNQASNGGWPWFEGGPDDWYITQHIVTGMGHLDKLGVENVRKDSKVWNMLYKAVKYCDDRMREDYEDIKKWNKNYDKENHLDYMAIQYIYARSYFLDIDMDGRNKTAFNYFKAQEQKYWLQNSRYMQGMIALGLNRYDDKKTPKDILKSLKENALVSEEMGMYWKENYNGFYWYEAPIESQSLLIEAFDEINNDQVAVDDLKTWLLKSKQTQNWQTTKATCEAVYALLLRGTDWLATEPNVEITVGDIKIDPKTDPTIKTESGTGYFKKAWVGSDIKSEMGKVKVVKKDEGVSWGAVYWQYFEQLDKITPHETPLKLNKKLFLQKNTAAGPVIEPITESTKLKPGDKIKVRIELRVDRDMQYVHMKDMRAAGFEPTNVFSGYKWQDGLGYYESTKDASTNFFFSYLNKGTYVFEYPLVVNMYGNFSNGITTIQCMYAPEFTSHSEGIRVNVQK